MVDSSNLLLVEPPHDNMASMGHVASMSQATTPSKRGHRHKRSFAVSGDFEFLKQPLGVDEAMFTESPTRVMKSVDMAKSNSSNLGLQSPRFFASEEPTFSSPFKGVPDAIINLDDALKTKPRSFKAHRRTESAPADLEILLSLPALQISSSRIDEEDVSELESLTGQENKSNNVELLSPLRPTSIALTPRGNESPMQAKSIQMNQNSPLLHNKLSASNVLKINKQKERSYARHIALGGVQNQPLNAKNSNNSLSSGVAFSPLSLGTSPYKQNFTPGTPVLGGFPKPGNSRAKDVRANGKSKNIFKFESVMYDISHEKFESEEPDHLNEKNIANDVGDEEGCLPQEVLLGQPGDLTDTTQNVGQKVKSLNIEESHRSVSDSIVETNNKNKLKKRSKFSAIMHIFSKD